MSKSLSLSLVVGVPPGEYRPHRLGARDRERPRARTIGGAARLCRPCCRSVGGMSMRFSLVGVPAPGEYRPHGLGARVRVRERERERPSTCVREAVMGKGAARLC